MKQTYELKIAGELNVRVEQVKATASLIAEDATVHLIARYRKELTGSLDEVAITYIRDRLEELAEVDKRREAIIKSLEGGIERQNHEREVVVDHHDHGGEHRVEKMDRFIDDAEQA